MPVFQVKQYPIRPIGEVVLKGYWSTEGVMGTNQTLVDNKARRAKTIAVVVVGASLIAAVAYLAIYTESLMLAVSAGLLAGYGASQFIQRKHNSSAWQSA